jgi:hypothetical protein
MTRRKRHATLIGSVVAAFALVLTACGSSNHSQSAAPPSSSSSGATAAAASPSTSMTPTPTGTPSSSSLGLPYFTNTPVNTHAKPIVIGDYGDTLGQGATSAELATSEDPQKQMQALIDYINAHGGVAGRPLTQVYIAGQILPAESGAYPQSAQDQAMCADFTEDHHVDIAFLVVNPTKVAFDCLQKAQIPTFTIDIYNPGQAEYMALQNLFTVQPSQDRVYATLADALQKQGYFSDPGMKLGVVVADNPWWSGAEQQFLAHAKSYGVVPKDIALVCPGFNNLEGGCTSTQAQLQNVVLKFKAEGINHVVQIGSDITTVADAQKYYPRYSYTSDDLGAIQTIYRPGRVGIGFTPQLDFAYPQEPPLGARWNLCLQIMHNSGQVAAAAGTNWQQALACEEIFLLQFVGNRDPSALNNLASFRTAMINLGSSYNPPASGFSTCYGPNRYDGGAEYRIVSSVASCKCLQYTSGDLPMDNLPGQTGC